MKEHGNMEVLTLLFLNQQEETVQIFAIMNLIIILSLIRVNLTHTVR